MSLYYDDIEFKLHMVDGSTIIHSDKNREWEDHKYYKKVETSKGKYRYFYTKAEYDAFKNAPSKVDEAQYRREKAIAKGRNSSELYRVAKNEKDAYRRYKSQAAREAAQRQSVEATKTLNARAAQDRAYGRTAQGAQEARERAQRQSVSSTGELTERFNNKANDAQAAREAAQRQSVEATDTRFPSEKVSLVNRFDGSEKNSAYAKEASMWAMATNLASGDLRDDDGIVVAKRLAAGDDYDQLMDRLENDVEYNLDKYSGFDPVYRATIFNIRNPKDGYGRYQKSTGYWPMETKNYQPDHSGLNKQLKSDLEKKLDADAANNTDESSGIIKMPYYSNEGYPGVMFINYSYDNGKLTIYDTVKGKAVDSNNLYQYIRNNYGDADYLDLERTATMRTDDIMFKLGSQGTFKKKIFSVEW